MRAEFDTTPVFGNLTAFLYLMSPVSFVLGATLLKSTNSNLVVIFAVLAAVFFAAGVVATNLNSGSAYADEEKFVAYHEFFGKSLFVSAFRYEDIAEVLCEVKSTGTRFGSVIHEMILTVKLKDEMEFSMLKRLDISGDFPASQPEEYKEYISEQPLMQLSNFINEKLHLNTSA